MSGSTLPPRVVVVTRPTDYESLLLAHGTREQARFYLETRGGHIESQERAFALSPRGNESHGAPHTPRDPPARPLEETFDRHQLQQRALDLVARAVPAAWRRARVGRADLDRFLFEPEDIIVAVGQDGLVANVAKYARGQLVIGVNPSPAIVDGILARHPPELMRDLLPACAAGRARVEERSMVQATAGDGTTLLALNEIFVGHRSHQSARYTLSFAGSSERQSSSGLIVSTGTGASGWATSVSRKRQDAPPLPAPTAPELCFLVREPWPSVRTGTELAAGVVRPGDELRITSEMSEGGVAFGDGIEDDRLELPYGQTVTVSRADRCLRWVG